MDPGACCEFLPVHFSVSSLADQLQFEDKLQLNRITNTMQYNKQAYMNSSIFFM